MNTKNRTEYMKEFRERQRDDGFRRVNVTLNAEEFDRLNLAAKEQGIRITSYLKACAFAHLDTRYIVPKDLEDRLDNLVGILRGIGNNLNQLARHSNEMHYFLDTEDVRLKVRRMEDAIRELITEPKINTRDNE
jgi:hypothetical protein